VQATGLNVARRVPGLSAILAIGGSLAPAAMLTAAVAVGLFVSRIVSDFVPDALAIGVCMFAAGALGGGIVGFVQGVKQRHSPSSLVTPAAEGRRAPGPRA
jgi:hypothetical protein